jgi:hypothetical protein
MPAPKRYIYHNKRQLNTADFERRSLSSELLINPISTPASSVQQLESTITSLPDQVAPFKQVNRPNGRKSANCPLLKQLQQNNVADWNGGGRKLDLK